MTTLPWFYRAHKLFNNKVSVRDYIVQEALRKGGLTIGLNGEKMTLNKMQLINDGVKDPHIYRKKWGNGGYSLIDYEWKEDKSLFPLFR